jgi:hypothetical protein
MNCANRKSFSTDQFVVIRWLGGLAVVFALLGLFLFVSITPVVLAQDTPTPTLTPTPSPATTVISRIAPVTNSTDLVILVIATLLFAMLALAALLLYMYRVQSRYYDIASNIGKLGQTLKTSIVQAFDTAGNGFESAREASSEPAVTLTLTGPGLVEIGQDVEYTAKLSDGTDANAAVWTVEPKTAAALRSSKPGSFATAKLTPAIMGAFILSVEVPARGVKAEVNVAAIAPTGGVIEVPFVGRGYGSIAIAIVIIAAVIILALAGVLGAESVGALLAALLGYIFGVTSASNGGKREREE